MILALDIATKTGWCTPNSSGVVDLKGKRDDSEGIKILRLRAKVKELIELEGITTVVYERPAGRFKSSIMFASKLIGGVIALCEEMGVNYTAYSAKEIKKYWTGNGNASKALMIETTKEKCPDIEVEDDNHADAIALYKLAVEDLDV